MGVKKAGEERSIFATDDCTDRSQLSPAHGGVSRAAEAARWQKEDIFPSDKGSQARPP